ncbi:MAG TPA: SAM-dependent chlorinase/fluorinase [Candidatus Limnocylindria bacterium]|nr:SAM-dependent chlorinase/fluorinase [Candidatus Limnocylindria bacterium]
MSPVVALLSDFGTRDPYVAQMKGTILERCPAAQLVDVTHEVAPGDVIEAAWHLACAWRFLPAGTVFLCVVDPEVGTTRRAVAMESDGRRGVGPDNGLFGLVAERASTHAVELTRSEHWRGDPSHTFWGRDVFAPVAALLAQGAPLAYVGDPIGEIRALGFPRAQLHDDGRVTGSVIHVDRFGNVITNVPAELAAASRSLEIASTTVALRVHTYHEAPPGELVFLVNSAGHVEVALRDGHAGARLGVTRGEPVELAAG